MLKGFFKDLAHLSESNMNNMIKYEKEEILRNVSITELQKQVS